MESVPTWFPHNVVTSGCIRPQQPIFGRVRGCLDDANADGYDTVVMKARDRHPRGYDIQVGCRAPVLIRHQSDGLGFSA